MADQAFRHWPVEPKAFPGEGQIGRFPTDVRQVTGGGQDLETAVKNQGMRSRVVPLIRSPQTDFGKGLAAVAPQSFQRAEGGAQIDARGGLGAVVGRQVLGEQSGFQGLEVDPFGRRRTPVRRGKSPLRMEDPGFVPIPFAEYFEPPGLTATGTIHHQADPLARLLRATFTVKLGVDERAEQLQLVDGEAGTPLCPRYGGSHGAEEGAGHYHAAVNPVVLQPSRVGRVHIRFEGDLAPG